jgi:predicted RNA binding protein YcfA (HicA-like mRNA interferase family)
MKAISGKELARVIEQHGGSLLRVSGSHLGKALDIPNLIVLHYN